MGGGTLEMTTACKFVKSYTQLTCRRRVPENFHCPRDRIGGAQTKPLHTYVMHQAHTHCMHFALLSGVHPPPFAPNFVEHVNVVFARGRGSKGTTMCTVHTGIRKTFFLQVDLAPLLASNSTTKSHKTIHLCRRTPRKNEHNGS
jgi:hypothetical protein